MLQQSASFPAWLQHDMEQGLGLFGDNSFDTVLCLSSLQMMQHVEALLRDIVRDMIRDELQGNLGERITRNVRKLVRAEINRALASRDFE